MSFWLSIHSLRRTKMECQMIKYIQNKARWFEMNTVLVWNRLGIIVSMLCSRGVPSLQGFPNAKRAFVNNTGIVKIYAMVE